MIEYWFKGDIELGIFIKNLEKIKGITDICPAIINDFIK